MNAAERTRDEPDRVGHVGDQRRVTDGEQRRERDQRPRTDDNIDRSRSHAGAGDGKSGKRAHLIGLYRYAAAATIGLREDDARGYLALSCT